MRHLQEVKGLSLTNVASAPATAVPALPDRVSMLYGRARRYSRLTANAVAVPLAMLYGRRDGRLRYRSREELAEAFLFDPGAKIVASGVDVDQSLERYWGQARGAGIVDELAALRLDLVTVPNFSLFVDVPREDNLHNMKRIAICWRELAAARVPAALHLNARTDADWRNWTSFLLDHPEIGAVTVEFATGLRIPDRGKWHVWQLERLAQRIGRDLHLIARGERFAAELRRAFHRVTIIDTSLYMKTMRRKKLVRMDGKRHWRDGWTLFDQPLDELLQQNENLASDVLRTPV